MCAYAGKQSFAAEKKNDEKIEMDEKIFEKKDSNSALTRMFAIWIAYPAFIHAVIQDLILYGNNNDLIQLFQKS